ncbi:MAG: type I-E CRISPR-associated protein Cse1/CasA [Methanoculleaceae archaeon]
MNLIHDRWIPVVDSSGSPALISPSEIVDCDWAAGADALNAPRPDFNGALIQFLIGIVQTAHMPDDDDVWLDEFEEPPTSADLERSFSAYRDAFNLAGSGPRFMQDPTAIEGKSWPIESLFIGMPGENTRKNNTDFFNKRDSISGVCPRCAAAGLMSIMVNGPQGGKGHRAGLRGGGPITTVILGRNLWETVWLNVLPRDEFYGNVPQQDHTGIADIFPWMGPLRTSEGGSSGLRTGISDVNLLQMFWPMNLRIYLDFDDCNSGTCDICGEESDILIRNMYKRPAGVWYDESWRHILTPYYESNGVLLPVHCNPGGLTYRHWLGIVQTDSDYGGELPRVVTQYYYRQTDCELPENLRIWAFGYDLDKVKARCWYDSTMPIITVSPELQERFAKNAAQIVRAADYIAQIVHRQVKEGLYRSEGEQGSIPRSKNNDITIVKHRFWKETEPLFYETLRGIKEAIESGEDIRPLKEEWVREVGRVVLGLFDFYVQTRFVDVHRPRRIVAARKKLLMSISPGSPKLARILQLERKAVKKEVIH